MFGQSSSALAQVKHQHKLGETKCIYKQMLSRGTAKVRGLVVIEERCRRALAAPRPSELGDPAAPGCTRISTQKENNTCINNYPTIAPEKAAWQRAPCLERCFLPSPEATLSRAEGTVPPERAHSLSAAFENCTVLGERKSLLYSLWKKGSGRNCCSEIFALLWSPGLARDQAL